MSREGNPLHRLIVQAKIAGRKGWSVAPLEIELPSAAATVRDLLEAIVCQQVDAFVQRKEEAKLLRTLTERRVADGAEAGKIAVGNQEADFRTPDAAHAIQAAVTAFEDGFYYIFVNDTQIERLDQPLAAAPETKVLFLRLTPLVGG
jgi:hypothetical protein